MSIVKFTLRERLRRVPTNWAHQYRGTKDHGKMVIQRALDALDLDTCTKADIDTIIGNGSWTDNECAICGAQQDVVVTLSDKYFDDGDKYDGQVLDVCEQCVRKAMQVFES